MPVARTAASALWMAACAAGEPGSRLEPIGEVSGVFTSAGEAVWFSFGNGVIRRLDLATRTTQQVGAIEPTATDLAAIGERVYWTFSDHGALTRRSETCCGASDRS